MRNALAHRLPLKMSGIKVKEKQSRFGPGVAQRVSRS